MSASHFTLRKRILLLLLLLAAAVCVILFLTGFPFTPEKKFDCFTRQVFCEELSGNTLSLHYTVASPSDFGLENLPISLGDGSTMAQRRALAACENYQKTLDTFSFEELNASQQVTYAILRTGSTPSFPVQIFCFMRSRSALRSVFRRSSRSFSQNIPFAQKAISKIISHC